MSDRTAGVAHDEHKRHIDHAAYQAAIEREALKSSGITIGSWKSTEQIEAEVFGTDKKGGAA